MKFKVIIKPDSIGAWEEKTNWFIGERDEFMVGYEGERIIYKKSDKKDLSEFAKIEEIVEGP